MINGLTASTDDSTLYSAPVLSAWSVPSSRGEARAVSTGEYAVMDRSIPLNADHGGYFSSGSMDAKGRLLIALEPLDSWLTPLGILATGTGRITRVPGDGLSDNLSGVWTPNGRILSSQVSVRATISWSRMPRLSCGHLV